MAKQDYDYDGSEEDCQLFGSLWKGKIMILMGRIKVANFLDLCATYRRFGKVGRDRIGRNCFCMTPGV